MTAGGGPSRDVQLIVADAGGVKIWTGAEELNSDSAPNFILGGATDAQQLALASERLFVTTIGKSSGALLRYENVRALGATSSPDGSLVDSPCLGRLYADDLNRLWVVGGSVCRFDSASDLDPGAAPTARYTHPYQQLMSIAHDGLGDKLLAAQPGGGVFAWNAPLSLTGDDIGPSFTLSQIVGPSWLEVHDGDLYAVTAGDATKPPLGIWRSVSKRTDMTDPDVVVAKDADGLTWPFHISFSGTTMVVTNNDAPDNYGIAVYLDPGAITSESKPDLVVRDPELVLPTKAYLDSRQNLYVLSSDYVLIFGTATSAPVLKAKLEAGVDRATDFLIVE
jgi:hypothetical protein